MRHLRTTLNIFHVISENERVFVGEFFPLSHLNSSNFTLFLMKRVSRFYLICVGGFLRGFHWYLEPLAKIKRFLSKYLNLSTISDILTFFLKKYIIWNTFEQCFSKYSASPHLWIFHFSKIRPQIGFCPQIGWKSTNRVCGGFHSYYVF